MDSYEIYIANFLGIFFISTYTKIRNFVSLRINNRYLAALLYISTIAHEFMHYVVAYILNANPTKFNILPIKEIIYEEDKEVHLWTTGSVQIETFGNAAKLPISIAPIFLSFIAFYLYLNWFVWFDVSYTSIISVYIVVYFLTFSSIPSGEDFKVGFTIDGIFFWTITIGAIYILHVYGAWKLIIDSLIAMYRSML